VRRKTVLVAASLYTKIAVAQANERTWRSFLHALGYRQDRTAVPPQRPGTWLARGTSSIQLSVADGSDSGAASHVARHGGGVEDVAFLVTSAEQACARAMAAGAELIREPRPCGLADIAPFTGASAARLAWRRTYGEQTPAVGVIGTPFGIHHTLYEIPGYQVPGDPALEATDHIALAVGRGELRAAEAFYADAFGFGSHAMQAVEVGDEGLESCVLTGGTAVITAVAPLERGAAGQIDRFLQVNAGPGVQHIALRVGDIVSEVEQAGVSFLPAPAGYYEWLLRRAEAGEVICSPERLAELRKAGVLVGTESPGRQVYQIFTACVESSAPDGEAGDDDFVQPSQMFFEMIERGPGATGFGHDNVKFLFESKRAAELEVGAVAAHTAVIAGS
jgi:4-hydroxyphenylpyruvate dioxygenase